MTNSEQPHPHVSTRLVHADGALDPDTSVAPPIYPSVTYRADSAAEFRAMATEPRHARFYARNGSPMHARVEALLAEIEGAEAALLLGSGMAAISCTVLAHLQAGDHVVAQRSHYMGTTQLVTQVLARYGVHATSVVVRLALLPKNLGPKLVADFWRAAQGYDATPEEVMLVGERLTNVARVWNVRAGFTRADDTLPDRLLMEPLKTGASQGHRISPEDRDFMLNEYYSLRGWDAKGVPTPERLKALGLGALAADLPRD